MNALDSAPVLYDHGHTTDGYSYSCPDPFHLCAVIPLHIVCHRGQVRTRYVYTYPLQPCLGRLDLPSINPAGLAPEPERPCAMCDRTIVKKCKISSQGAYPGLTFAKARRPLDPFRPPGRRGTAEVKIETKTSERYRSMCDCDLCVHPDGYQEYLERYFMVW